MDPWKLKRSGKTYLTALQAVYKAQYFYRGRPFIIVVPNLDRKYIFYEQVMSITKGVWPIGLKIKTIEEIHK